MSFVGKDAAALCHQVKGMTGDGSGRAEVVMHHLTADDRINMGFAGLRGIDPRVQNGPSTPSRHP